MILVRGLWALPAGLVAVLAVSGTASAQGYAPPPSAAVPMQGDVLISAPPIGQAPHVESLPTGFDAADHAHGHSHCDTCGGFPLGRKEAKRLHRQRHMLGFPEEWAAPPLGAALYAHNRAQVSNGEAARMVLHEFDFVPGTNQLNTRGRDRLEWIASRLPHNFHPIWIERTTEAPGLDQSRRMAVLGELAGSPFPVPAERVMVGRSPANGLRGPEAESIHRLQLYQTETAGTAYFPTGAGGGGTVINISTGSGAISTGSGAAGGSGVR